MNLRIKLVFIFFILFFLGIISRLFYWQIIDGTTLADMGIAQYEGIVKQNPIRGEIETSDGFPIAANQISYLLYANPKLITNNNEVSSLLGGALKMDTASISAIVNNNSDKVWVEIANNIDQNTKDKISSFNIPGVGFEQYSQRFYPEASMAATLLGFVGKDANGNNKGYFGLEGYYDDQLKGRVGQDVIIRDAFGRPVYAKLSNNSVARDGRTLVLNVNRSIQFLVENALKNGIEKYGAKGGSALVMDPKTGAVLAMANFPSFDEATYWKYNEKLYVNPMISNVYEPGSTFKPIVMSAAIDDHLITPTTQCPICAGPVPVGGYLIHTWDDKYFPNTTMTDVLIHSDNTGMVFVAQKLGVNRMIDALNKFGIGELTGIDLQGETYQSLNPPNLWYAADLATTGFGQGVVVTPIELLDAISSIANKGVRMQPEVVKQIITSDGQVITIPPKEIDRTISPETAKIMTEMMVEVANKGEASWARLKGYRIAGKTGTASIPTNGKYDSNLTIASFIGFAPADNPKFAMLVILNKPTADIYGADTAAPIFFEIAKDLFRYYNIPPSGN